MIESIGDSLIIVSSTRYGQVSSRPKLFYLTTLLQHKPHIAYLLCLSMDLSVTYFNIVRGRKNQRPRQPVPSTLLALIKCARRTNQDKQILLTVFNSVFQHGDFDCKSGYRDLVD